MYKTENLYTEYITDYQIRQSGRGVKVCYNTVWTVTLTRKSFGKVVR